MRVALTSVALTLSEQVYGAAEAWSTGGPYGGPIQALVPDPAMPSTLYAGTSTSVFKSTDSGTTWAAAGAGLPTNSAYALAIDPKQTTTLYAGYYGAFKSTDSGGTWTSIGLPYESVWALAIDPVTPSTVYAGTSPQGVFKSTDGGSTWDPNPISTGVGSVFAVLIDPAVPSRLYAGSGNGAVWTSTDSGQTWAQHEVAPQDVDDTGFWIKALAIDPANPTIVYAGTNDMKGIYKSTDFGTTWGPANAGMDPYLEVQTLAIDPTNPATVYAGTRTGGVFKSTDAGGSWTARNGGLDVRSIYALSISAASASTVYAGSGFGVFKSVDAGGAWNAASAGLLTVELQCLAADPTAAGTIYAGTLAEGVFKSVDSGASWLPLNIGPTGSCGGGAGCPLVNTLVIDPRTPTTLYAGTRAAGLLRSTDAGAAWSAASTDLVGANLYVSALAIDPMTPTTLYAATWDAGYWTVGVFKSTDSGSTWRAANTGLPAWDSNGFSSLVIDGKSPTTLYLGNPGIYKSTNGGATWAAVNPGLPPGSIVRALAIDPFAPNTVYAATYDSAVTGGVLKSTDAGGTWASASTGLNRRVLTVATDPARPGTLYAGTASGVFKSTNSSNTWARVDAGLPRYRGVGALAVDPVRPTLYAAAGRVLGGESGSLRGTWQASPPPLGFLKGDLDGNGQPDLVFRSNADAAHNKLWLMDAASRIGETSISPDAASADWLIRGVDDFDRDGRNDLVFWNQVTGSVEFWLMNGAARIGAPVPLTNAAALDTSWELAATADFDQDGEPDIVWRNSLSQEIRIWIMQGTRNVGSTTTLPSQAVDANWSIVAALDYDDDGNTDLLWYNATSGKLVSWYLNDHFIRTSGQFTTPSAAGDCNWKVVASGDFSGASSGVAPLGAPDIVWRNETSGNQVVWHMDFASTRVHGEFTNPAANSPALDWTIVGPR